MKKQTNTQTIALMTNTCSNWKVYRCPCSVSMNRNKQVGSHLTTTGVPDSLHYTFHHIICLLAYLLWLTKEQKQCLYHLTILESYITGSVYGLRQYLQLQLRMAE